MKNLKLFNVFFLALISGFFLTLSCSPAGYEIIKPKKGKDERKSDSPERLAPDESKKPAGNAGNKLPQTTPPTAGVEVIWQGRAVTQVLVNQPVTIQPTVDTVDPDDIGKINCRNPGIVDAEYDLGNSETRHTERTNGCEPLKTPYTFTRTGEYNIRLDVLSNEGEPASASMVLKVVDKLSPDAGFTIDAIPMLVGVNQAIQFYGYCLTPTANVISWSFADGAKAKGTEPKHSYAKTGQYKVDSTCVDSSNNTMTAWVTIVVVDQPLPIPGGPTGKHPPYPFAPTDPDPTDPNFPGQNPGQFPGQIPGQVPGQKPAQR
jgi:hypothetical protein